MRLVPNALKASQQAQRRRNAFTLMEILVVVAIIVVLAGVASVYVFRYLDDAKVSAARSSCVTLAKAAQAYNLKFGNPPSQLSDLVNPPDGGRRYIEGADQLVDPWNKPYQMTEITGASDGEGDVEVFTMTPQGKRVSSIRANNQQ